MMQDGIIGPDLPPPDQPFTKAALLHRWPAGAEKVEVGHGALYFSGGFDGRDVVVARRVFPGRRIALSPDGGLIVGTASGHEVDRLLDLHSEG